MDMGRTPQMSGMPQVVMNVPSDAELLDAAEVKRDQVMSGNTIKNIANVGEVIDPSTVLAEETVVRLSKNQKLRMAHKGFNEVEATWKTTGSYEEVAEGSTTVYRYVAPGDVGVDNGEEVVLGQARPLNGRADNDDGIVITDNGTFSGTVVNPAVGDGVPVGADLSYLEYTTYSYDGNASSSSANDGLVGPRITAIAAEYDADMIVDTPGKIGGEPVDSTNYLTIPGRKVRTGWTHKAMIQFIGQIADGLVVKTELTVADIIDAGVPVNAVISANLTDYQDAVAATGDAALVNSVGKISQLVKDVNDA